MSYSTYSFADVSVVVANPVYGQYIATGAGLGSITTDMTTERTVHDVAADGSIMVSKIKGRNGTIAMAIQQTSDFNDWLQKLYNFLESAPTSYWASTSIYIRSPIMGDVEICTGVSFGKQPSKPRQAEGQKLTWTLMAADIQREVI